MGAPHQAHPLPDNEGPPQQQAPYPSRPPTRRRGAHHGERNSRGEAEDQPPHTTTPPGTKEDAIIEATPTEREARLIQIALRINTRGRMMGDDVRALNQIGISILTHLDGLVPDPTTAVSMGQVSDSTALLALSRWAHHDPTRRIPIDPTLNP